MTKHTCGQVLVLPSRRLVRPAADDDFVINKTYQLKYEKCAGGKLSKIQIISIATENIVGDNIPMFVTGKS